MAYPDNSHQLGLNHLFSDLTKVILYCTVLKDMVQLAWGWFPNSLLRNWLMKQERLGSHRFSLRVVEKGHEWASSSHSVHTGGGGKLAETTQCFQRNTLFAKSGLQGFRNFSPFFSGHFNVSLG